MHASRRLLVAAATLSVVAGLAATPPTVGADDGTKPPPAAPPAAPAADSVIDGHVRALGAVSAEERARAADELVSIGAPAATALGTALSDPVRGIAAADVLARIGPPARAAVPQIVKALAAKPGPLRTAAVRAAVAMGADGRPGLPALIGMARAPGAATERPEIVRAIGTIASAVARGTLRPENAADRAAVAACAWLVRHQNADGSWSSCVFPERCSATPRCTGSGDVAHDAGVTGVAALALLGSEARGGASMTAAADRALAALAALQAKDGGIGLTSFWDSPYSHAYATLALATALRGGREALREPLTKAVKRSLAMQSAKDGGWGYIGRRPGQSDTPMTTGMLDGLLVARDAGIEVPADAVSRGLAFLDSLTEVEFGKVGYDRNGGPPSRLEGVEMQFPASESESCTAAALATRLFAGIRRGDAREASIPGFWTAECLPKYKLPRWDVDAGCIDVWYWCAGSRAYQQLGTKSEFYKPWRDSLLAALLRSQKSAKAGCVAGSWDTVDAWSKAGGRIYVTAFAAMALQACAADPVTFSTRLGEFRPAWNELEKSRADPDPAVAAAARLGSDAIREAIFR